MTVAPITSVFADFMRSVSTVTARFEERARAIARGEIDSEDIVGMIEDRRAVEADLATVRVADEMIGSLLDMVA